MLRGRAIAQFGVAFALAATSGFLVAALAGGVAFALIAAPMALAGMLVQSAGGLLARAQGDLRAWPYLARAGSVLALAPPILLLLFVGDPLALPAPARIGLVAFASVAAASALLPPWPARPRAPSAPREQTRVPLRR